MRVFKIFLVLTLLFSLQFAYSQDDTTVKLETPLVKEDSKEDTVAATPEIMEEDTLIDSIPEVENEIHDTLPDCVPPCRAGYFCHNGKCVSMCNPPCPEGTRCDPNTIDCIQLQILPSQQKKISCKPGKIRVNDECLTKKDIYTTGNVIFTITDIFFGIGTAYSAIAPLIAQKYSWYDYGYEYGYYNSGYSEGAVIASTAPQTGMFVIAGILNQIPKTMQKNRLEDLGETPSAGLIAASWALWGTSVGTATWNIFNNLTENRGTIVTSGIINCIVLFSSYIVSNVAYVSQQEKLRMAVHKRVSNNYNAKQQIAVAPYYIYSDKTNKLGVMLQF